MFGKLVSCTAAAVVITAGATGANAEDVTRLSGRQGEPAVLVRHEPGPGPSVIYVHGATFPSALSVSYRIDGRSWMDDLRTRGFDVWAFDLAGYGGSDRPAAMVSKDPTVKIPGRAPDVAGQIERVVLHILEVSGRKRVSVVAHSWGTIPAGLFAGRRPDLVERLVLFGPVARREGEPGNMPTSGSYPVTVEEQRSSFAAGLPQGRAPLFARALFEKWVKAYLATDPHSGNRSPKAVLVPSGWAADFAEAWSGKFPYDPAIVRGPTLILRGEWDNVTQDADAAWLRRALSGVPGGARDAKLPRGGHRMHLEENRQMLFDTVAAFLPPPIRQTRR